MKPTTLPLSTYPSIIAVMSLLDCGVTQDLDLGGTGSPQNDLFALGDAPEAGAGLTGFTASPCFTTLADLARFCAAHMSQYEDVAAAIDRDNAYPQKWFWEDVPKAAN